MSRDRRPAAAAERRRPERAINAIRPARTTTPSRTHSQVRLVPEEVLGAADPVAGPAGAAVVTLCVGGCAVTLGLPETVAVRLGRPPTELPLLPHPAASNPAARTATTRESLVAERRMLILPQCSWPAAGACAAGDTDGYGAGHCACGARPDGLAAWPPDP